MTEILLGLIPNSKFVPLPNDYWNMIVVGEHNYITSYDDALKSDAIKLYIRESVPALQGVEFPDVVQTHGGRSYQYDLQNPNFDPEVFAKKIMKAARRSHECIY